MSDIISLDFNKNYSPAPNTSLIGQIGEDAAARFLERRGYDLVVCNFRVPIGRNRKDVQVTGEIDIIALDEDVLCFVEVKTRSSDEFSTPQSAVDLRKQRQIMRTARVYRKIFNLQKMRFRYDVVAIVLNKNKAPKIELFKAFWTEEKFRKKIWLDDF